MSCIEKMTIQGIRSFGPDARDVQCIQFFSPLTLILGQNGTGKTTIIECLKYMTTGDLPPGGKQNAAFIHDPKVAGESIVHAQISLLFRDLQSQRCCAKRSMTATQKQKKVEMKTVDNIITRTDKAGNKQSINSKCAEIDREMVQLLGVAKPILDSVIFCHQEESNWPLCEPKALKQKFDDIFASTRYVKALEVIRKFRTSQKTEIDIFKAEIKHLKMHKDKAAELEDELKEQQDRYVASREAVQKIKEKIQPIKERLFFLNNKANDIYKLETSIEKKKTEQVQIKRSQDELRKNIRKEFQGSTLELKRKLQDFAQDLRKHENALLEHERNLETLTEKLTDISEEKSALLVEQGILQQEAQVQQQRITNREKRVRRLAESYHVTGFDGPLTDRKTSQFMEVLFEQEQSLESDLDAKRMVHEEDEQIIQQDIDELKNKRTKIETELSMKQDTLRKNHQQIREIKQKLSRVEASGEKLTDIQKDLKNIERELEEAQSAVNVEELKEEAKSLQAQKSTLDVDLKRLDNELNRLSIESSARTQLDIYKKERNSKMDNVRMLKAKIEDNMTDIVGYMPSESFRRELDEATRKLSRSLRSKKEELQRSRQQKTMLETQCKMQREQLSSKQDELRGYESQLSNVSGSQNFDEGLEKLKSDLRQAQEEKGHLMGLDHVYRKYEVKLGNQDPPCPLCHRKFNDQSAVDELVDEIKSKLALVPERVHRTDSKINNLTHKVDEMTQLRPVRSAMMDLQKEIIPELKQKISSLMEQLDKVSTDVSDKEEEVECLQCEEVTSQSIQGDVAMIDKLQAELRDLDKKIAQQSSRLSGGDSDRTMQDVQSEREQIQDKLEDVNRSLERKRQKVNEHTERVQNLSRSQNLLEREKLEIESELQQRTRLEETKVNLESSNDTLGREIKDNEHELQPLQKSIQQKEKDKQQIAKAKRKEYEEGMEKINAMKEQHEKIKTLNNDITSYVSNGKDQQLDKNKRAVELTEQRANRVSKERDTVTDKINSTKEEVAEQKIRERELRDNLSIRDKEEEIGELQEKIDKEMEDLAGVNVGNIRREIEELADSEDNMNIEKNREEGRRGGLEEAILRLKRELKTDMYKDAEVKYREKMIALKTTEMAHQDLDKYYRAMDQAIMSYHTTKMAEINKIIRELWRNTYKGNDIETIEIQTENEDTASAGASKGRRTYNYRVVMIKGATALEMRNRCSAGQKVLASLIIRLALAETFCLNCGILALDEPTTNLDRENIESLAFALVEIIKSRSRQRNFQLIVITHDEEFLELLGRADFVEEFFKVRKNADGCSQLVRARIQDLDTR